MRYFDLPLNHKKTKIEELPVATTKHWVRQLNAFDFTTPYGKVNYKKAQSYLDMAINLMEENGKNAAILNYAIKVLSKQTLTQNAQQFCLKTILHLAVIYPYIIPLLDEYVFVPYAASVDTIARFANVVFETEKDVENYEAMIYAIYFAIKYNFDINSLNAHWVVGKDSCLLKCCSWLYYKQRNNTAALHELKSHAMQLADDGFDENWLFVYEALPKEQLHNDWKPMKAAGISFVKQEYRSYAL